MRLFICKKCREQYERPDEAIKCPHPQGYTNDDLEVGDIVVLDGYENYFHGDPNWVKNQKQLGEKIQFVILGISGEDTKIAHIVTNGYDEETWDLYFILDLLPHGVRTRGF